MNEVSIRPLKKMWALVFILLLGGGLWAQNFTFELYTGLYAHFDDDQNTLRLQNTETGLPGMASLKASFVSGAGTAGLDFELRSMLSGAPGADPGWVNPGYSGAWIGFQYAYAWLEAMDSRLTLFGGKVNQDVNPFRTLGGVDTQVEGSGIQGVFTVIPNLDIGLAAYTTAVFDGSDDTLLENAKYVASASYNIPRVGKIVANFLNHATGYGTGDYTDQMAFFGIKINGLASLGFTQINLDAELDNLGDFSNKGIIRTGQVIGYNISGNPFWAYASFQQVFYRKVVNMSTYTPDLMFYAQVLYAKTEYIPSLDLCYVYGSGGFKGNFRRDRNGMNTLQHTKDRSVLQIRPAFQIRFGHWNSVLNMGYALFIDFSKNAPDDNLDHAVFLEMKVII
jgi:hypothetical protein